MDADVQECEGVGGVTAWRRAPHVDSLGALEKNLSVRSENFTSTKAQELRSFLLLAVLMAPAFTVAFVSGYGFVVWMYQVFFGGPPGPPGG